MSLSKVDWAYIAALIDGEGCISMGFGKATTRGKQYLRPSLQISIANTSKELIAWIVEHFGGNVYTVLRKAPHHKDQYHWHVLRKKEREKFLLGVLPYLKIKAKQANLALEWIRLEGKHHEARHVLADQCQRLNQRGKSVTTNTLNTSIEVKRESELCGDVETVPVVIQAA